VCYNTKGISGNSRKLSILVQKMNGVKMNCNYFDFDTAPERKNTGSMKYHWLPEGWAEDGILTFSGAELDLKTAPCISEALARRAQNGLYGYTLPDDAYLDSLRNWLRTEREWEISNDWIVPTYGIIQALNCCIRAFTKPGDAVLIQPPTYHMYAKAALKNERRVVENPLIYKNGYYEMDFEDLEKKMSGPEVKLMVLCNPQNPIMDFWGEEELKKLAALADKYHVVVFSDEIFAEHSYAGTVPAYGKFDERHSIVLTSLGKAFNFTGFSHGNAVIRDEALRSAFIEQRDRDHFGSIDPFIYAAQIAAYSPEGKEWLQEMLAYSWENAGLLRKFFADYFPEVICCRQRGGTLVWVDLHSFGMEEEVLHTFLQKEARFQSDKGSIYGTGGECFTRIEVGTPRKNLEQALDRLLAAAKKRGL